MGSRNPDRVPVSYRRRKCETVGDMIQQGWDVHSRCMTCGTLFRVNLRIIARLKGPDFSIWNRKDRCRRLGCSGHVEFHGRAPDMSWHEVLNSPEH